MLSYLWLGGSPRWLRKRLLGWRFLHQKSIFLTWRITGISHNWFHARSYHFACWVSWGAVQVLWYCCTVQYDTFDCNTWNFCFRYHILSFSLNRKWSSFILFRRFTDQYANESQEFYATKCWYGTFDITYLQHCSTRDGEGASACVRACVCVCVCATLLLHDKSRSSEDSIGKPKASLIMMQYHVVKLHDIYMTKLVVT